MANYILKRFAGMALVIFIVLTLVFVLVRLAPGDPAALMLGPEATAADIAALRSQLGLDQPILVQYLAFIADVLRGDLGTSIFFNQPVADVLIARAEPTVFLTLFSILIAVAIALPVGIASAYTRGSLFDQGTLSTAILVASVPSFWLGLIIQQQLGSNLGLLPVSGYGPPEASFGERMTYLIMPAIVLGIVNSALIIRFTRASMLDVLSEDFVRTARSKGMSESRVVLKHAFKNALIPIVTVVGLTFALLISGAVVTERVFNLPGIGSLVVGAVLRRDYPTIQGALIVVAALYVFVNFLIDMLYLAIDPRVKY
ncbi:ABC transporter permease subunit [Microvirga tunisiensis]|uniref:ABC transporter permease subunit n=2 Tax=Pannonibacter tanglangensis TaxID=2750084 RepID=A0ABW9ZIH9_9HYPH|nr:MULTISPECIES: ABC transporter permease [unclassified Pannonibacter]NBN64201.1 ABC transporter permease subunit [Pannonibacter sp. XCT-34]NBN78735.1 ABC transporter permease subunit [Pannonibacter sp. XCT-53]